MRDQMQIDDDLGGMFGTAFTFDDTLEQDFPKNGSLRVVCDRGAINVTPSDGNTIRVVVHKKLYANNQDDANRYNEGSKPQITANGSQVLLNANTNGAGDHAVQADMDIFVPRDASVDVASKRGDVSVSDRKADVKLTLQKGDITLNEITGNAKMSLDKGSIRASDITGDVEVEGRVDNVTLDDVKGAVHLNGDFFNDIRLSKITKTVEFKSARSDIYAGVRSGRPGDFRRLVACHRRQRTDALRYSLQGHSPGGRDRRLASGKREWRHRDPSSGQAADRQDDADRQDMAISRWCCLTMRASSWMPPLAKAISLPTSAR